MKNRKYSKLKNNPLVRLIRSFFSFFRRFFKPKQDTFNFRDRDRLIKVSEVLDLVKWQCDESNDK